MIFLALFSCIFKKKIKIEIEYSVLTIKNGYIVLLGVTLTKLNTRSLDSKSLYALTERWRVKPSTTPENGVNLVLGLPLDARVVT